MPRPICIPCAHGFYQVMGVRLSFRKFNRRSSLLLTKYPFILAFPPQARMSWAQLLKRVFAIDMAACPQCGGPLTILAPIENPTVIAKILAHLGLPHAHHSDYRPASTNASRQPHPTLDFGSVPEPTGFLCPVPQPPRNNGAGIVNLSQIGLIFYLGPVT